MQRAEQETSDTATRGPAVALLLCDSSPAQILPAWPIGLKNTSFSHTVAHRQSEITFSLSPGFSQQGITQALGRTGNFTTT